MVLASGFSTIELLSVADALVTDYSAVAYEAAAVGVPVFFHVPDIDDYRKTPGLNVDPLQDYPGCSSRDLSETLRTACLDAHRGDALAQGMGRLPRECTQAMVQLIGRSLGL